MGTSSIFPVSVFAVVAIAMAACSGSPNSDLPEHTSSTSSAIIGGTPDTTHQAVVLVWSNLPSGDEAKVCSGTIIKTDPANHIGWVLTAAHCTTTPPTKVIQGDNYTSPSALLYQVVDYKADPAYDPNADNNFGHDFAVVRISGVDATTPVIPITSNPDNIADAGTLILAMGYGKTTPTNTENENTLRNRINLVAKPVPGYPGEIEYDQTNGGICYGDSGGPDLLITGGVERVVGVHEGISLSGCLDTGYSGRVSYALSFIKSQLPPDPSAEDAGTTDGGADSDATDGSANSDVTKDGGDSDAIKDDTDSGTTNDGIHSDTTDDNTNSNTKDGASSGGCSTSAAPPSAASHGALFALGATILAVARRRRHRAGNRTLAV